MAENTPSHVEKPLEGFYLIDTAGMYPHDPHHMASANPSDVHHPKPVSAR